MVIKAIHSEHPSQPLVGNCNFVFDWRIETREGLVDKPKVVDSFGSVLRRKAENNPSIAHEIDSRQLETVAGQFADPVAFLNSSLPATP